jgi:hypothetical protein
MTILAAAGFGGLAALLIVLACPLMMIFMMRGMHGGGQSKDGRRAQDDKTLEELKAERDALNEEIGQRAERHVPNR